MRKYIFVVGRFRDDLNKHLSGSSVREMSKELDGEISPSKLSRYSSGKQTSVAMNDLLHMCSVMGTQWTDYVDRVLM